MIPIDYITEWRQFTPWPTDTQVEQDLIISRALVEIFSNSALASSLAFRGGTALHKLYVKPAARYSEDIDLVQIKQEPIGNVLESLRTTLDSWLGPPKREFNEGLAKLVYRVQSEGLPPITMRIKVEINTREHFAILGWKKHQFEVKSRWFTGKSDITTYSLEELLGTKLRALYQRKKGRDLFDLWICLKNLNLSTQNTTRCFSQYMKHGGYTVTPKVFEENLKGKMADKRFTEDISPLLRPDISWNIEEAMRLVSHQLLQDWGV